MQKLIFNFKYKPYLTDLKTVLADLFYESIIQNEQFTKQITSGKPARNASQASASVAGGWLLVPIPLSKSKLRKRGYNQAEILAEELGKKFNLPADRQVFQIQNLLERTRETKTQVGLTNLQRKLNVQNAFQIHNSEFIIHNSSVFLVDDVATTGSTLLEASKVLKRAGAGKVFGLTLARD